MNPSSTPENEKPHGQANDRGAKNKNDQLRADQLPMLVNPAATLAMARDIHRIATLIEQRDNIRSATWSEGRERTQSEMEVDTLIVQAAGRLLAALQEIIHDRTPLDIRVLAHARLAAKHFRVLLQVDDEFGMVCAWQKLERVRRAQQHLRQTVGGHP